MPDSPGRPDRPGTADDGDDSPPALATRPRRALARTWVAVRATATHRPARRVLGLVSAAYLGLYLFAVGHLRPGPGGFDLFVVGDPVSRAFQQVGPLSFEAVAAVTIGPATLLVAPVNLLVGGTLSLLVGVNLAVSYLAYRHPAACGIGPGAGTGAGIFAGLPALLSGAACCGPVVLLALGVQATGLLLTAFGVLVPAAALLLVGSLVYVGRTVDPTLATRPGESG
jgi:hypothetical protein